MSAHRKVIDSVIADIESDMRIASRQGSAYGLKHGELEHAVRFLKDVTWENSDADERTDRAEAVTLKQPKPVPITGRESGLMSVTGRDGNDAIRSLRVNQGGRVWTLVVTARDGNGGIMSARITEGK